MWPKRPESWNRQNYMECDHGGQNHVTGQLSGMWHAKPESCNRQNWTECDWHDQNPARGRTYHDWQGEQAGAGRMRSGGDPLPALEQAVSQHTDTSNNTCLPWNRLCHNTLTLATPACLGTGCVTTHWHEQQHLPALEQAVSQHTDTSNNTKATLKRSYALQN